MFPVRVCLTRSDSQAISQPRDGVARTHRTPVNGPYEPTEPIGGVRRPSTSSLEAVLIQYVTYVLRSFSVAGKGLSDLSRFRETV